MKFSLAYVFIAASTIVVVNSESNPRHRFLKAKASKVGKSKTSKSKSSKSAGSLRCAITECPIPNNVCQREVCLVNGGCNFPNESNANGACDTLCCAGVCCPEGQTFCQFFEGVEVCGGS